MEPRNTGVNLGIYDIEQQTWLTLEDTYLQEATTYQWRYEAEAAISLLMQGIPLPMTKTAKGWEGSFQTPFQVGKITFKVNEEVVEQSVYPDQRKLVGEDYERMLSDIVSEGAICFQLAGLTKDVKGQGRSVSLSYLQWQYIKNKIFQLRSIFRMIEQRPLRLLQREDNMIKREQVKTLSQRTTSWIERHGERYGWTPKEMPGQIQANRVRETFNRYENQVIVAQMQELRKLLLLYRASGQQEIFQEADRCLDWLTAWRNSSFLEGVSPYRGSIVTSQSFRKHPYYRAWDQWFVELYNFQNVSFDMKQSLALRDTYDLYEIWCYLQVVKALRELDLVESYQGLFFEEDNYFFLTLAKNRESKLKLKNGGYLTFQRVIQNNSKTFYSYTQRMIPDITLEWNDQMVIFDPKYRVEHNIPYALAEMHKYRDGILSRETNDKVVKEVYILTPTQGKYSEEKDFYSATYHEKYKMGALLLKPGKEAEGLRELLGGTGTLSRLLNS